MTDIEILDGLLSAIRFRSTVYEHEIFGPLMAMTDPRVSFYMMALSFHVSEINGDRLIHAREYLNALLDLRNELTCPEAPTDLLPPATPTNPIEH